MATPVVTQRQLNRTTLSRQMLLARQAVDPTEAVERLVGLQAQIPLDPYLALWSRLEAFDPHELGRRITERDLVRIVVMRGTIHLVSAADACFLRPLIQPVLDRELATHGEHKAALASMDLAPILSFARPLLAETPLPGTKLRAAIAGEFPGVDAAAAAYACRNHLALVQVPPRGVWGKTLQVTSTPLESWVGQPLRTAATVDEMVLRYLAAFGPASPADATAWSGLPAMREVFDRLGPKLRSYRTETGRELFDLAEAELADPDLPAPVRFLPTYDNALLSHADRSRFLSPERSSNFGQGEIVQGTVLVDGTVAATWRIERDKPHTTTTLHVDHPSPLTGADRDAVEAEGRRVLTFQESAGVDLEVQFHPL